MRIISGKYKGRQLHTFKADHIRPTTDRVKESLFNILRAETEGASVLDLFAGTGNLGLEALSRGASSVCFVESSRKSLEIIRKNLDLLKPSEPVQIVCEDVIEFFKKTRGQKFDLIFADPPFTKKMAHQVLQEAAASDLFTAQTIMSIESERRERVDGEYGPLFRFDVREFGDKVLSFYQMRE